MAEPASKLGLAATVYESLKERILDQTMPPGARVNIDALAEELGVSPTPLREALVRLTAERLTEFAAFRGYAVAPLLTDRQLSDLFYVRRLLECDAARLAAQRITESRLLRMESLIDQMKQSELPHAFAAFRESNRADQRFHESLIAATENDALLRAYKSLAIHSHLSRLHFGQATFDFARVIADHTAILTALRTRDVEGVRGAVVAHLDSAERFLASVVPGPHDTVG